MSDSLPILVPALGFVLSITLANTCCLRRQLVARYENLADRVLALEHKSRTQTVQQDNIQTTVSVPSATYPAYPAYSAYQQPSAPAAQPIPYAQPFSPYTPQTYSV